jgi:hypothetical protein
MIQPPHQFRAGDRVHLISPLPGVAAGAIGTVLYRFLGASIYDVRFDGQAQLRLIEERKLAPAPLEAQQRGRY